MISYKDTYWSKRQVEDAYALMNKIFKESSLDAEESIHDEFVKWAMQIAKPKNRSLQTYVTLLFKVWLHGYQMGKLEGENA